MSGTHDDAAEMRTRSEDLARRIADARAGRWPEAVVPKPYRPMGFFERIRLQAELSDGGRSDSSLDW